MDSAGTPKIADFGFSDTLTSETEHLHDQLGPKGSPRYMAPEIMERKALDKSVDVYAFGIILYELMTGKLSFSTYNDYYIFSRDVIRGVRPEVVPSDNVPAPIAALMARCWDADPAARPTFEEIVQQLRGNFYEVTIPEVDPRAFWMDNFEDESVIRFGDICRMARNAGVVINHLEEVLCDREGAISMAHFTRLYRWFGQWYRFERSGSTICEIEALVKSEWFHGFIDKDKTMGRLAYRAPGTFLVRLSDTTPGFPFTISYVGMQGGKQFVSHFRIKKVGFEPSAYEINNVRFGNIVDIVAAYAKSGVFTFPCPKVAAQVVY